MTKLRTDIQSLVPDLTAILLFVLLSFIYFAPAVIEGREIAQHDSMAAIGVGQEQRDFMKRHDGERTRWNISMFGGMPSYQMSPTTILQTTGFCKKPIHFFFPTMSTCCLSCWQVFTS